MKRYIAFAALIISATLAHATVDVPRTLPQELEANYAQALESAQNAALSQGLHEYAPHPLRILAGLVVVVILVGLMHRTLRKENRKKNSTDTTIGDVHYTPPYERRGTQSKPYGDLGKLDKVPSDLSEDDGRDSLSPPIGSDNAFRRAGPRD